MHLNQLFEIVYCNERFRGITGIDVKVGDLAFLQKPEEWERFIHHEDITGMISPPCLCPHSLIDGFVLVTHTIKDKQVFSHKLRFLTRRLGKDDSIVTTYSLMQVSKLHIQHVFVFMNKNTSTVYKHKYLHRAMQYWMTTN